MKKYEGKSVYICGKITGDKDYRAKFYDAEMHLIYENFQTIVNPADIVIPSSVIGMKKVWQYCMRVNLSKMLLCDYVYALKDAEKSNGACIEMGLAKELGIKIIYEEYENEK